MGIGKADFAERVAERETLIVPEINRYSFSLTEITELLLREQGITEGYWESGVAFQTTPLNAGVNGQQQLPALLVQVASINLARVPEPTLLSIDAARLVFPEEIAA